MTGTILKLIFLLFFIPVLLKADSFSTEHVLFGERDLEKFEPALFFDCEGTPYPRYFIADTALAKGNASLRNWYQHHLLDFEKILHTYHCEYSGFSENSFRILNDSICANFRMKINASNKGFSSLTFMIHGFRKHFIQKNHDSTSPTEFKKLEENLGSFATEKTLFIPVYWDGLYGCCFSLDKEFIKGMADIYIESQSIAKKVGIGLSAMLYGLDYPKINVLTYSLGALVGCNALFTNPMPTNQTVNICMLAAAIGGDEVFKAYERRFNLLQKPGKENYRLAIAFNNNDFVLKKKDPKLGLIGPGPYKYGNTTLGCNHKNAVEKLRKSLSNRFATAYFESIDLSIVGKCHLIRCYAQGENLKPIVSFFERSSSL